MSSLAKNYKRRKISFNKGKGSFLYSSKGVRYLDFVQGIAVNSLGHSNPNLNKALLKQSKKVWHVSNAFEIPEGERLAKRLTKNTFADYVLFQNSGAEATEAAVKAARKFFYLRNKPFKNRILCIKNSFHGRTLAAIYASGSKKMTEGFGPKVPGFDHFEFGDHEALKRAITKKTAAIMVEPVLGEGGIKVIPKWCLKALRKICNQKKILLIIDEVQSGIGRSGKFFAFEYSGIKPDIVPIAKGIGGGFPIGAVLMNKKVAKGMTPGSHGSTFGGNPLAMEIGNAVLDQILKKYFLKNVQKNSKYFLDKLKIIKKDYPHVIKEVRGLGFMIGIEIKKKNSNIVKDCIDKGLILNLTSENVIRLLPPLITSKSQANFIVKTLCEILTKY